MNNDLGNNIRNFRKNKGLTQEELADLLNITPQAVSRWESTAGMPDVSMLIPLAQTLGVSTDALLGYDMIREDREVTSRIRETVKNMFDENDRSGSKLKICEYLSTETNIHPGNYEIIKDYVEETASLSMYWDDKLENCYADQDEHIRAIFKDSIKKGTYLISHCADRELVERTHYAIAWVYIHMKDFDKAKEHINVLPGLSSIHNREVLEMETVFFDKGFESMKEVIDNKNKLLFKTVARHLYTVSQNYGWWGKCDEALGIISWCDAVIDSFAMRPETIEKSDFMHIKVMNAFHKMVALTKAGEKSKVEAVYASFVDSLSSIDWLSEEDKKECIATLDHEIEYYGKYTG
jgi:transcriptional regulator with XRE-family HTH domain